MIHYPITIAMDMFGETCAFLPLVEHLISQLIVWNYPVLIFYLQENDSLSEAVSSLLTAQPCVIMKGSVSSVKEAILVIEKTVISSFPPIKHGCSSYQCFLCFQLALYCGVQ